MKYIIEIETTSLINSLKSIPTGSQHLLREWLWARILIAGIVIAIIQQNHLAFASFLIGGYFTIAIVVRLDPLWSFGLALMTLIFVPFAHVFRDHISEGQFASYSFYFFVIGIITGLAMNPRHTENQERFHIPRQAKSNCGFRISKIDCKEEFER